MKNTFVIAVLFAFVLCLFSLCGCSQKTDADDAEIVEEVITQIIEDDSAGGEENSISMETIVP